MSQTLPPAEFYGYRAVPDAIGGGVSKQWWNDNASEYLLDHGEFLGEKNFCWCPEGIFEADAGLLGSLEDLRGFGGPSNQPKVLEIGAGAGQCSRWLVSQGVDSTATDISSAMLAAGSVMNARHQLDVPLVTADARALPFDAASFDVVFSAYGAIPFVPDAREVHLEVHRVLKPGGRWVFSTTHPIRWAFPDDPSEHGLTATRSYFDRDPYVETDAAGQVTYTEYHRTIGDHLRDLTSSGFSVVNLVEPEWPSRNTNEWGGWSPTRGTKIPGTAIFVTTRHP